MARMSVLEFKREKRQKELVDLTQQAEEKEREISALNQKLEEIQQKHIDIESVEQITAKPAMFSSKVSLEKQDYDTLVTAAQKYVAHEKQESKWRKLYQKVKKTIEELKATIKSLNSTIADLTAQLKTKTEELADARSTKHFLRLGALEEENRQLKLKIKSYETTIDRNNLWNFFSPNRSKHRNRDDAR